MFFLSIGIDFKGLQQEQEYHSNIVNMAWAENLNGTENADNITGTINQDIIRGLVEMILLQEKRQEMILAVEVEMIPFMVMKEEMF